MEFNSRHIYRFLAFLDSISHYYDVIVACLRLVVGSLQHESHRESKFHADRLSVLHARLPFRHGADYADSFCIQPWVDRTEHLEIAQRTVFPYHKLHDDTPLLTGFLCLCRIPEIACHKFQTSTHTARIFRHLFHYAKRLAIRCHSLQSRRYHLHIFLCVAFSQDNCLVGFLQTVLDCHGNRTHTDVGHLDALVGADFQREIAVFVGNGTVGRIHHKYSCRDDGFSFLIHHLHLQFGLFGGVRHIFIGIRFQNCR